MRVFGIDPGSERTGYGCVESDGRRHHLVACGAITAAAGDDFPQRLERIHRQLTRLLSSCRADCVAIENLFHAKNARSALKLGHARGVAMLAAVQAGCEIAEYTPAEVKRAVVGYGRAEKPQVQRMVKLLLALDRPPTPYDASDALAVAICHLHSRLPAGADLKVRARDRRSGDEPSDARSGRSLADAGADLQIRARRTLRSWRQYRPPSAG